MPYKLIHRASPSLLLNLATGTTSLRSSHPTPYFSAFFRPSTSMAGDFPYVKQNVQEVQELISNLTSATAQGRKQAKKTFSCKKTDFKVLGSPTNLGVSSWRFQEWDYKRDDLPTFARGLFTSTNEHGQPEIAIRGYDKFFNYEEVSATRWRNIEQNTTGPYELSLKENGCIIFISGLHDGTLLVCSKHSTGPRDDADLSHAVAGEKWIDRQLKAIGKTREDLAKELRKRNATAVAELCDDEFEEHILQYDKHNAGLYLHGINVNTTELMTYPGPQIQAFADEWGFRKTDFLVIDDIHKTKEFLEGVAETGSYNGREVEGFVIRCRVRARTGGSYSNWFFKYKFEEPYLMYRQWRECTKAIISGKPPRFRKHAKITEEYLMYTRNQLAKNPKLAKEYQHNHGIIKLRDDFLKEKNLKGSDIIRQEYAMSGGAPGETSSNVILVPIATIGCGKTTIAIALKHLFDWGHVQNDNITGKNRPPRFTKEVLTQLEEKPVVYADRNNAQRHERDQILSDVHQTHPHVRLIALHFVHSPESLAKIRQTAQDRVFSRGDNHQTIQAATDPRKVIGIMDGFINRFEALNPDTKPDEDFDTVIELDPAADSRENLETVITQLSETYPKLFKDMPTNEDMDEAIKSALSDYKPDLRHEIGGREKKNPGPKSQRDRPLPVQTPKKKRAVEYFSVTLRRDKILDIIEEAFASVSSNKARFFRNLQENRRIQPEFHVTLIHRASSSSHPELWKRYSELYEEAGGWQNTLGECKVLLERIVWDNRIMAIVARLVDGDWECANEVAHITVGMNGAGVKPKESNDLLKRWLVEGSGDESGIGEIAIEGRHIVNGVVKSIQSR